MTPATRDRRVEVNRAVMRQQFEYLLAHAGGCKDDGCIDCMRWRRIRDYLEQTVRERKSGPEEQTVRSWLTTTSK